jgi:hypothetical protein
VLQIPSAYSLPNGKTLLARNSPEEALQIATLVAGDPTTEQGRANRAIIQQLSTELKAARSGPLGESASPWGKLVERYLGRTPVAPVQEDKDIFKNVDATGPVAGGLPAQPASARDLYAQYRSQLTPRERVALARFESAPRDVMAQRQGGAIAARLQEQVSSTLASQAQKAGLQADVQKEQIKADAAQKGLSAQTEARLRELNQQGVNAAGLETARGTTALSLEALRASHASDLQKALAESKSQLAQDGYKNALALLDKKNAPAEAVARSRTILALGKTLESVGEDTQAGKAIATALQKELGGK